MAKAVPRAGEPKSPSKIKKDKAPADAVREFRQLLTRALNFKDDQDRIIASAKWGVYAFFDHDNEPIYVGQTVDSLRGRVRRHLTNQRTDAVAMRILDVFEVAKLKLWPLWEYKDWEKQIAAMNAAGRKEEAKEFRAARRRELDALEYSVYLKAIEESRFDAILNEKIPPISDPIPLPPSYEFDLVGNGIRKTLKHEDIRIARRAETISRLAAVAHERGEVSDGLRRVLVVQAVRLAYITAERLAQVEGREAPAPEVLKAPELVGDVRVERTDPHGRKDKDEDEEREDDGEDVDEAAEDGEPEHTDTARSDLRVEQLPLDLRSPRRTRAVKER